MTHRVGLVSVWRMQYPIHDTPGLVGVSIIRAVYHTWYSRLSWRQCYVCSVPYMTHNVWLASVLCVQYPIHEKQCLVGVSAMCAVSHT